MTTHKKGIQSAGWLDIVIGLAILLTPFFAADTGTVAVASAFLAGGAVIVLAGYNVYVSTQKHSERAMTPAMLNVLIGIWVLASGFVLPVNMTYTWWTAVLGLILIASAGFNTWAASDARRTAA